jgi:hypothetical protein
LDLFKSTWPGSDLQIDADVKQAVTSWLQTFNSGFFCAEIQATVGGILECEWSDVYNVLPMCDV